MPRSGCTHKGFRQTRPSTIEDEVQTHVRVLITGDLVRGHMGGKLNLLPDAKLTDHAQAIASVQRILDAYPDIETVLVGDGWPVFHDGRRALAALCGR